MKKVGVIGFNIFSSGGTTRSNINLIKEFTEANYSIKFFNYHSFKNKDIASLLFKEAIKGSVEFFEIKAILSENIDLLIITREQFFPISKIMKSLNPNCKIVAEIHSPINLITNNIEDSLDYIDCIRVSTESIKQAFIKKYQYNRVFAHTVSLKHLNNLTYEGDSKTNNLLIYSRFDESSKDVAYAIKVVGFMVNELKYNQVKLFINGYGPDESIYKQLILKANLENNIFINAQMPRTYIYLSTSKFETFGYSIIESLKKGHRVILFEGEDKVIREIYKEFKLVRWINKQEVQDALNIVGYLNEEANLSDYEHDNYKITHLNKEYLSKYIYFIESYSIGKTKVLDKNEIKKINNSLFPEKKFNKILKRIYRGFKRIFKL